MTSTTHIIEGIKDGSIVPFIGPGALNGVVNQLDGSPIPADSDSLILAMNNGKPMSPRLMYEFPRAAMNLENKKGRKFIENFLTKLYGDTQWTESAFHRWIHETGAPYVIDINRDTQLQTLANKKPHNIIIGAARLAAHPYRFDIYEYNGSKYSAVEPNNVDTSLPVIFKPLGSPIPKASYIASDADFVDYITELMGGFAIPTWIKDYRKKKQYVFLGMRFTRDTERMIMSDFIYSANEETTGWAFIKEPNDKEIRFLKRKNIEIIEQDWTSLVSDSEKLEEAIA